MSLTLSIKNFQSIKEANLNLSGFTVITGSSNLGKSAVRRAFATVIYNDWDASYIRDGYKSAEIELERNENLIKVKKEYKKKISKENSFCVNGKIYEKMGDGLPDLIDKETKGIVFVERGCLNVSRDELEAIRDKNSSDSEMYLIGGRPVKIEVKICGE